MQLIVNQLTAVREAVDLARKASDVLVDSFGSFVDVVDILSKRIGVLRDLQNRSNGTYRIHEQCFRRSDVFRRLGADPWSARELRMISTVAKVA
jgi:hypothetical protein